MSTIGEKLRREREHHQTTLEELARSTMIDRSYFEALERNDFGALPGRAFGKFFIRAYAEVLDFDPRGLIAEYHELWAESEPDEPEESPSEAPRHAWEQALQDARAEARDARMRSRGMQARRAGGAGPNAEKPPTRDEAVPQPRATVTTRPVSAPPTRSRPSIAAPLRSQPVNSDRPREIPAATDERPPAPGASVRPGASRRPEPPRPAGPPRPQGSPGLSGLPSLPGLPGWTYAAGVLVLLGLGSIAAGVVLSNSDSPDAAASGPAVRLAGIDEGSGAGTPASAAESGASRVARKPGTSARAEAPRTGTREGASRSSSSPKTSESPESGGRLAVSDSGVGSGVVNHFLDGESDRFEEGAVVSFWTRVTGGTTGDRIRHVWYRGRGRVQTIRLRVGGSPWRTHSRKTLWGVGDWSVEARDETGRVLARSTFTVVPGSAS